MRWAKEQSDLVLLLVSFRASGVELFLPLQPLVRESDKKTDQSNGKENKKHDCQSTCGSHCAPFFDLLTAQITTGIFRCSTEHWILMGEK